MEVVLTLNTHQLKKVEQVGIASIVRNMFCAKPYFGKLDFILDSERSDSLQEK